MESRKAGPLVTMWNERVCAMGCFVTGGNTDMAFEICMLRTI